MSDGQSAFAEPMTMQEALAKADSLSRAKEAEPAEPAQEPEDEAEAEEVEAEASQEVEDTDEPNEPEGESEESEQILTADEYGDVLVDVDGEPTPLAEVLKGTLRQADYTRKTMALKEEREAAQQEIQERQKALDAREQQLRALEAELGETEPDWEKLAEEDPLGYNSERVKWERKQAARKQREADLQKRQEEKKREFIGKTVDVAVQKIPEWQDVKKFDEGAPARKKAALEAGFTEEEYASTPDFRIAVLLEKAARYDAMSKDTGERRARADKKIAKAPKVLRPGATKPDSDPKQERRAAFQKRLSKPISSTEITKALGLR